MALASVVTTILEGVTARPVTVEANIGAGLPGMYTVGLVDTTVRESRDRIKTAVVNSKLHWPKTKVVVSLSPAGLPKSGSHFDLPMSLAILAAQHPFAQRRLAGTLVLGELGLDGTIRPVSGVLPALLAARTAKVHTVIIPPDNAAEAGLITGVDVRVAHTLSAAWEWATGHGELPLATDADAITEHAAAHAPDFADIQGQEHAKHVTEIVAAGGHHMFLIGPPGAGKSMIAERLPSIMPALSEQQAIEATAVHSVTGTLESIVRTPPYVAPHHSITRAALLGGGNEPRPGAVSLAHHGVLFLDEVSEIPARVLDGLRTPLEFGRVKIIRSRREVIFPARFQLVLAANPCRCGATETTACTCSGQVRSNYLRNLSGPLRDRLDVTIPVPLDGAVLTGPVPEASATIAERVAQARLRAEYRWARHQLMVSANAHIDGPFLRRHAPADDAGMAMLGTYLADGLVSQRGVDKTLKLAWTLADLAGVDTPTIDHVAQALDLRLAHGAEVSA